jgi:hypothetical protein
VIRGRIGNTGPGRRSLATGSGATHRRVPFGHITVAGKLGDTARISSDEIFEGVNNGNIQVQATGGSVAVYCTLADIDLAFNPEQDSGGHWVLDHTAAPGAITELKTFATALRLEFQGNAVIYISGI